MDTLPAELQSKTLKKALSGIQGLDEITEGGLPQGRPTLVCGAAGSGKTLLAMEFIVRGATQYDEPGVFMAFEETNQDLTENVASLGFDLDQLTQDKKLLLEHVWVERKEIEETGEYDLEGLFIRLGAAIDEIGAKRVVLDTLEALFAGFSNEAILRSELRRLFHWLKDRGVTAVITGERGEKTLTRQGLEEYVSDCVILLDHRVYDQISTRRLRIVKYRGTTHGTNEYPFLIDKEGISILPITSLVLDHPAHRERLSTGLPQLDDMLEGKGFFRGSSVLVSGTAGAGKTILASQFVDAATRRGQKVLYFAFEESAKQICRNMQSVGLDLAKPAKAGSLVFHASRPTLHGLEMHLVTMYKLVQQHKPDIVVVDPITNLINTGTSFDVEIMLTRLIDFLKMNSITAMLTSLTFGSNFANSDTSVSSLIDTWLMVKDVEDRNSRTAYLSIVKSRGMAHTKHPVQLHITNNGIKLADNAGKGVQEVVPT